MTMRLTKPVTRIIEISGDRWNVTLGFAGLSFRAYRSPKRSEILLPYPIGLQKAAWLAGDRPTRKRRVKRGAI